MIGRSKLAAAADLRAELNAHNDLLQVFSLKKFFTQKLSNFLTFSDIFKNKISVEYYGNRRIIRHSGTSSGYSIGC